MANSISVLKNTQETFAKFSSQYSPPFFPSSSLSPPSFSPPSFSPPFSPPSSHIPIPSHYMYLTQPSTYPSLLLNNDSLSQTTNTSVSKVVPELKEFLEGLDMTYGNGKYTQYLEILENHDIRVSLIPKISDEWWEKKLQITSLGHILTLKDEAKKYV